MIISVGSPKKTKLNVPFSASVIDALENPSSVILTTIKYSVKKYENSCFFAEPSSNLERVGKSSGTTTGVLSLGLLGSL